MRLLLALAAATILASSYAQAPQPVDEPTWKVWPTLAALCAEVDAENCPRNLHKPVDIWLEAGQNLGVAQSGSEQER